LNTPISKEEKGMFLSPNGEPPEQIDLETIRAWYTEGYLEGLLAGLTDTESEYLDDVLA
jgi:hypothetical protein